MRNAYVDYTPQMFLMTNPDYNSFLREWIQDFYLDERGIPIPELAGRKRWWVRQGNSMLWYNSLEEAQEKHGKGPESGIRTFTFIGANCRDNPPLLKAQPDYISNLMALPRVEKERLLDGSWFARQEASGLFKREWCTEVDGPNLLARKRVRSWDCAFSLPSEQYKDPDYTRGVLLSKDDDTKIYTVENVASCRQRVHDVEKLIMATALEDGPGTIITLPQDPGGSAAVWARGLQTKLAGMGFTCRLVRPIKSKVTRFAPFSSVAQAGFIHVVKSEWNKEFYEELEIFDGSKKNHDDIVDACSDAILTLNKELSLPVFNLLTMQSMTQPVTQSNFLNLGSGSNFRIPTYNNIN